MSAATRVLVVPAIERRGRTCSKSSPLCLKVEDAAQAGAGNTQNASRTPRARPLPWSRMAIVWVVDAVELGPLGNLLRVRWGAIDIARNAWVNGKPHMAEVADVVAHLCKGAEVWTILPNGIPGPRLRTACAKVDRYAATVEMVGQTYTIRDLNQLSSKKAAEQAIEGRLATEA